MTLLVTRFFSVNDFFLVPLCFVILYAIIRNRANACHDTNIRKYYFQAFYYKVFFVVVYAIVTEFYFGGGDTNLYYQGVKDLRAALDDDFGYLSEIISSEKLDDENPLSPYFMFDNYAFDITYNYMRNTGNFFVPRLGLLPSLIFFNSYLCLCLCFALYALGGAIRTFKVFYHYYPTARRELALAILFLPGVTFWSAGFLKDTICFGALGFFVYGVFNLFIRKRKFISSIAWILLSSYLLYSIKTYIFLVLLMAVVIWIFAETNDLIKDKTLRNIFAFMTLMIGAAAGYFMLDYFTSQETLKQYQLENIVSSAETQRANYLTVEQQTSYYSIDASNPFLLVVNSLGATFFRPFPWEIRSAAAVLSAMEAMAFLILTINLFFKKGLVKPFKLIFKDPRIIFCFIFAVVFAIGVGASTANFGTLSRYKIPCMPFFMTMLLLLYRNSKTPYPKWLQKTLSYIK